MALQDLLSALGKDIEDSDEETFLLFSQALPSQNLGFIDATATSLEITVSGRDMNIMQSPTLLSSTREGGTTGAVVWKITPLFAEWIASSKNCLFQSSLLNQDSVVLELGCGISGIVAIILAPKIGRYLATDQDYVFRWLKPNLEENATPPTASENFKKYRKKIDAKKSATASSIQVITLDWISSSVSNLPSLIGTALGYGIRTIDAVIACDCIYNEALIEPFVRTCTDICHLGTATANKKPTLCVVAQQLRSDTVFESWLSAFLKAFRVWRIPDELLSDELREGSGFVIHIGVLREATPQMN
ncbi:hypothetical protein MMC28_002497 [Mycoblastus sanguinarius]|nr:hypothetical protein [Mycoblastus sanguinarius]